MSFEGDLRALTQAHKARIAWDRDRASAGKVRRELERIVQASQALVVAVSETTEQTRACIAGQLTARGKAGAAFTQAAVSAAGNIMQEALDAKRQTPAKWLPTARRITRDNLREIFERHGHPFTAWASDEHLSERRWPVAGPDARPNLSARLDDRTLYNGAAT